MTNVRRRLGEGGKKALPEKGWGVHNRRGGKGGKVQGPSKEKGSRGLGKNLQKKSTIKSVSPRDNSELKLY